MAEYVQVLTTVGSEEAAAAIGGALLEQRLAACVQTIGPITSRYRTPTSSPRSSPSPFSPAAAATSTGSAPTSAT